MKQQVWHKGRDKSFMENEVDIDISLLEDSLRLTPWQRLIENDRALALVRMLEDAKARENGTSQSDPRETES
jgi:hypothetical protein